ncbi:MAG: hypothetical protein Q7T25_12705 [Sideroxyarcus sp.]|nr:hypothetical protein [Sideroxyarcus sp.]
MKFGAWMRAVLLSTATLVSVSVLAAEPTEDVPALSDAKVQTRSIKHVGESRRTDSDNKTEARAAAVVESTPALPGQGGTPTVPAYREESLPTDNSAQHLGLKGVRG